VGCLTGAGGLVWALAITVLAALADGTPASDYDAGNRAAFGMLLVLLAFVLPIVQSVGYWIAAGLGVSPWRSAAIAHVPAVAIGLAVLLWW